MLSADLVVITHGQDYWKRYNVAEVSAAYKNGRCKSFPLRYLQIEGSRPEWCILSMIYSRDTPFWSETLEICSTLKVFAMQDGQLAGLPVS